MTGKKINSADCILKPFLLFIAFFGIYTVSAQTADFTMSLNEACAPATITFTDASTGGTVVSRNWNLGNGVNASGPVASANYGTPQTYSITLTVNFSNGTTQTVTKSITIHPKPLADFTADNLSGCATLPVQFTSTSTTTTGTITKYTWSYGSGGSALPNPQYSFTNDGNYTVSLVVENNWGCKSDAANKPDFIKVHPKPVVDFETTVNNDCNLPLPVSFINKTTGTGTMQYNWNFGDGNNSTSTSPTYSYTSPGVYAVTLTATNGTNCSVSKTNTGNNIIYAGTPLVSINAPAEACTGAAVNLSAIASPAGLINQYKWDMDDGNIRYGQNINYTFSTNGIKSITLTTTTPAGCTSTAIHSINVKQGAAAMFTVDNNFSCNTPLTVQVTNQTPHSNDLSYWWNFGNGQTSPQQNPGPVTYNNRGTYKIVLSVSSSLPGACNSSFEYNVSVGQPDIDFVYNPQSGCTPLLVNAYTRVLWSLGGEDPIVNYAWNFGEPPVISSPTAYNESHTYNNAGNYNITLSITTSKGCLVTSAAKPVAVSTICSDDGSGAGTGGGGFMVGGSCNAKYSKTLTNSIVNSTVTKWNFGDGSPDLELDANNTNINTVTHSFPITQKQYLVTITTKDNTTGTVSTNQKWVVVIDEKPVFTANPNNVCANTAIQFTVTQHNPANINAYRWSFGDGSNIININNNSYFLNNGVYHSGDTSYAYKSTGSYYPELIITDKLGCTDSFAITQPVIINGPIADFFATDTLTCGNNLATVFTSTSTPNGNIPLKQWVWNFGNGSVTTAADTAFQRVYNTGSSYATYAVTLTVTDSLGCSSVTTKKDYIRLYNPKANFYSNDTLRCEQYNTRVYNYSSAYNAEYTWYWGDGDTTLTSSTASQLHTYAGDGMYDLKLFVKDENGCTDTMSSKAYFKIVKPQAIFNLGDTSQCAPVILSFENKSLYSSQFVWNFGDGSTGSVDAQPAPYIYPTPGIYTASLIVTGLNNCKDTSYHTFRIKGPIGVLQTDVMKGCVPYNYGMQVAGSNIAAYSWDFGDGTPITPSPTDSVIKHLYEFAGKYLPNVILTSPEGCTQLIRPSDTLIVDIAKSGFILEQNGFCDAGVVSFTNTSSAANFSAFKNITWDFGDGNSFSGFTPTPQTFTQPGKYTPQLAVETIYGCKDTFRVENGISINGKPLLLINGINEACANSHLSFTGNVQSVDSITQYNWWLNNNPISSVDSVGYFFNQAGNFTLSFAASTGEGCADTLAKNISIHPLPVPNINKDTVVCEGSEVVLHAEDGISYLWSPSTGLQQHTAAVTNAIINNDIQYIVKVTNAFGCVQNDTVQLYADKKVKLVVSADADICIGDKVQLSANGNTSRFNWLPSTGLQNSQLPVITASPEITTTYTVTGYSNNSCPDETGEVTVNVHPLPTVSIGNDITVVAGKSYQLNPVVSNNVSYYNWQPGNDVNCASCANVIVTPRQNGLLTLTVATQMGCTATDSLYITVLCNQDAIYIPNAFTPNGDNLNDRFYILGYGIREVKSLQVFDRLGKLVFKRNNFQANNASLGWDGSVNDNSKKTTETFVYTAEVFCTTGEVISFKGTITAIR